MSTLLTKGWCYPQMRERYDNKPYAYFYLTVQILKRGKQSIQLIICPQPIEPVQKGVYAACTRGFVFIGNIITIRDMWCNRKNRTISWHQWHWSKTACELFYLVKWWSWSLFWLVAFCNSWTAYVNQQNKNLRWITTARIVRDSAFSTKFIAWS